MQSISKTPIYESLNSRIYLDHVEEKPVVVKVLNAEHPSPEKIVQFNNEYELTCEMQAAGVRKAIKKGRVGNRYALFLEYVPGITLAAYLARPQHSLAEKLKIAISIAAALAEVHAGRIIHKDLNPLNIILDEQDHRATLIDFGISSRIDLKTPHLGHPRGLEGTLAYISPEQTGRMNRVVGYRTDLYSLGVVLYQMFTGRLPFQAQDPLELVHAHIAQAPVPPALVDPAVPQALSRIILRLLAKNAEDRYQSAYGLHRDLQACLSYVEKGKAVPDDMTLGAFDVAGQFQIPEKLYGREKELATLLAAYERAGRGQSEMVLVAGYSGTGKSALVYEVHKPVTASRGYFISGKFDQYQRATPHYAFIRALEDFVELLLTEDEASLDGWKELILAAVGSNGRLLTEVIPNLELIIGPQPAVSEQGPVEAQNRFHYTFQQFIRAVAKPAHPLVIFMDDLQWADLSSLHLLSDLLKGVRSAGLLIIGAYRDNEVDAQHPFMKTLAGLRAEGIQPQTIQVHNLLPEHVQQLVFDTLQEPAQHQEAEGLANLIYRKTQGNSFFTIEFLKSLYENQLLVFDEKNQSWKWSVATIAAQGITDNVVELMAGKIVKMHPATQQVLRLAACIGNKFDLDTLAVIDQQDSLHTLRNLWNAVEENLLLPLDNEHKLVSKGERVYKSNIPRFRFSHDRVQQAAYSLIEPGHRQASHLQIGRLLLASRPEVEEDMLFDVANQLNLGRALISDAQEIDTLVRLNLRAARKAKESIAYLAGREYINVALAYLPAEAWEQDYPLTLAVHSAAAELEYLNGNFEQSEVLVKTTIERAKTPLEKAGINSILITQYMFGMKMEASLEAAIHSLRILGVDFPATDLQTHIGNTVGEIMELLAGKDLATLHDSPESTDPRNLTIVQLLGAIAPPAWIMGKVDVWTLTVLLATRYSLKYGNTPFSPYPYVQYGMILILQGAYELGYQMGEMACRLSEKWGNQSLAQKGIVYHIFSEYIFPWVRLSRENRPYALEGQKANLESGNYLWVGYSYGQRAGVRFYQGAPLPENLAELEKDLAFTRKVKQDQASGAAEGIVLLMQYLCDDAPYVAGEAISDEVAYRTRMTELQDLFSKCQHQIFRSQICYLFGEYEQAHAWVDEVIDFQGITGAYCLQTARLYYHALSRLRMARDAGPEEQAAALADAAPQIAQMEAWIQGSAHDIGSKYQMLLAEKALIEGKVQQALDHYQEAIRHAAEDQLLPDEALAYESIAELFISRNIDKAASVYLQEAHYLYSMWGARKKVNQLEQAYPHLLNIRSRRKQGETSTVSFSTTGTYTGGSQNLDLRSVLKASQTLSEEIVLSRLLDSLMRVLIENAGAQRGLILLLNDDEQLLIEAEGSIGQSATAVMQSLPVRKSGKLPEAIVQFVARIRDHVVLENATLDERFSGDEYVRAHQLLSVLCSPIINQGELLGLIYLENNLASGVFTEERIELIQLLSGQIAVSLENAQLYENLEEKVKERTAEVVRQKEALEQTLERLKLAQSQLVASEKMASLGQLTAGIAHEMNNPVNFVAANIDSLKLNFEDVIQLVRQYETLKMPADFEKNLRAVETMEARLDKDFLFDEIEMLLHGIDEGARRTAEIVAGLRNFSRLDEDAYKYVNLHEGIESTLTLLSNKFGERIQVHRQYGELPLVECLPGKINQVVMNILNNAIQAIGAAPGAVFISTWQEGNAVCISIQDTGVGMSPAVKAKVFDPFFTTKAPGEGTGLGLSISYGIIDKHNGAIEVKSEVGAGAEFIVRLPTNQTGTV